MDIQVGTKMEGRVINIEVNEQDALEIFGDKWKDWSFKVKFTRLSAYADSLVVSYLVSNHMISSDQGKSRMLALKEIMNS